MHFAKATFITGDQTLAFSLSDMKSRNYDDLKQAIGTKGVFECLRSACYPFVNSFDAFTRGRMEPGREIPSSMDSVSLCASSDANESITWTRSRNPKTGKTVNKGHSNASKFMKIMQQNARTQETAESTKLPVIATINTDEQASHLAGRTIDDFPLHRWSRTFGYCGCLEFNAHWNIFTSWYSWVTLAWREAQFETEKGHKHLQNQLVRFGNLRTLMQHAWSTIGSSYGLTNIEYRFEGREQWALFAKINNDAFVPINDLDHDLLETIKIVSVIAYQCLKINPQLDSQAFTQSEGVAIIKSDNFAKRYVATEKGKTDLELIKGLFPNVQIILLT